MARGAWTTAEELARLLDIQRDALTEQIEELRRTQDTSTPAGRATYLLCDYLITGSSKDAASWANDMEWKAVSRRTGEPIDYTAEEVLRLFKEPAEGVPRPLIALCRRLLRGK